MLRYLQYLYAIVVAIFPQTYLLHNFKLKLAENQLTFEYYLVHNPFSAVACEYRAILFCTTSAENIALHEEMFELSNVHIQAKKDCSDWL